MHCTKKIHETPCELPCDGCAQDCQEDWKQHLKDYHEFMQWSEDEEYQGIDHLTQEEAKQRLKEDLEFIIATNGGDLFETERRYMKLLEME